MRLSAGAAGAGDRARRQGRGGFPPVAPRLPGKPWDLCVERARELDHGARADRPVLAAYPGRLYPAVRAETCALMKGPGQVAKGGPAPSAQGSTRQSCVSLKMWNIVSQ